QLEDEQLTSDDWQLTLRYGRHRLCQARPSEQRPGAAEAFALGRVSQTRRRESAGVCDTRDGHVDTRLSADRAGNLAPAQNHRIELANQISSNAGAICVLLRLASPNDLHRVRS